MDKRIKLEIKLPLVKDIELVALEGLELMGRHLEISDEKIGEARMMRSVAMILLYRGVMSSSTTHLPVLSQPPQLRHGEIVSSQSLIISGVPPAALTPLSTASVNTSELPFLRGLPRKTNTFMMGCSILK